MAKIMLVEDDKSLREIYGARLLAEGYDIVSAGDGEEALALAIKERPGLIISDVMMPKISGFDMLDILRSSSETRNTKVIMMTALSSDDQRSRGEQLGADRYLVKSQVGIEDVVRVVHEVLEDGDAGSNDAGSEPTPQAPASPTTAPSSPAPAQTPPTQPEAPAQQQPPQPPQPPQQPQTPTTPPQPPQPPQQTPPAPTVPAQNTPQSSPPATPQQTPPAQPPQNTSSAPTPSSGRNRTIQPLNDPTKSSVDINQLLDKEYAKESDVDQNNLPSVATTDQERDIVNDQINQFEQTPAAPASNTPATTPQEGTPPAEADQPTTEPTSQEQPSSEQPAQPDSTAADQPESNPANNDQLPPPPPPPPMPQAPSNNPPQQPGPSSNPPRPPVAL